VWRSTFKPLGSAPRSHGGLKEMELIHASHPSRKFFALHPLLASLIRTLRVPDGVREHLT
jgi:hypothetical protein